MSKPRILIQIDSDPHASSFDAVVAVDAGVDQLLQYGSVEPTDVRDLVHGAIFTRGPQELSQTAIFVGGSNVAHAETLFQQVVGSFFGPMRVSVMFDASGANTTAAAAVLTASQTVDLANGRATVLAATGPVGQRAVRLLARAGAEVCVASRSIERAQAVCDTIGSQFPDSVLTPCCTATVKQTAESLEKSNIVIAAGAAGFELLPQEVWDRLSNLQVAIDLNAVPPAGIAGIGPMDRGRDSEGVVCHGAIGVGGLKMKIHKAALRQLFQKNDHLLDAEQIYEIGCDVLRNQ